jgi:hypothetical protein
MRKSSIGAVFTPNVREGARILDLASSVSSTDFVIHCKAHEEHKTVERVASHSARAVYPQMRRIF